MNVSAHTAQCLACVEDSQGDCTAGTTGSEGMPEATEDNVAETADQSPVSSKLKAWQMELKERLGQAMKQLEPGLLETIDDSC